MRKNTRDLFKDLERQQFTITEKKKGWMIFPPDKTQTPVVLHSTPSDRRAWQNIMADLRRIGYTPHH